MALINCSECGREISDKAPACPQCGAPVEVASNSISPGVELTRDVAHQKPGATSRISDNKILINSPLTDATKIVRDAVSQAGRIDERNSGRTDITVRVRVGYLNLRQKLRANLEELPAGLTEVEIVPPTTRGPYSAINHILTRLMTNDAGPAIEARDLLITAISNHSDPNLIPKPKGFGHTVRGHFMSFLLSFLLMTFSLAAFLSLTQEEEKHSPRAATSAPKQQAASAISAARKNNHIQFEALTGEWVNDFFAGLVDPNDLAKSHRILTLRGKMKNISSDSLRNVRCPTEMTVRFTNGRSIVMRHDDTCGDTMLARVGGFEGMGNGLVLRPDEVHAFGQDNDQQALLAKLGQALAVSGEYSAYEVESVRLKIALSAETPFGDKVGGELVNEMIPAPSERRAFPVQTNQ